ncbi:MAG: hypothetical protein U5M72_06750 [Pseudomonas sp.]|nr:hypothetical protein [Pseudomonas sp.]
MSEIGVEGDQNRVAGRDYVEINLAAKSEPVEVLSKVQRQMLHSLVEEIAKECAVDARSLWREVVHARVGVEHVGDIPRTKFLEAQDSLVCWRDNFRQLANTQLLIDKLTTLTREKHLKRAPRLLVPSKIRGKEYPGHVRRAVARSCSVSPTTDVYEPQYLPDPEPFFQVKAIARRTTQDARSGASCPDDRSAIAGVYHRQGRIGGARSVDIGLHYRTCSLQGCT